MIAQDYVRFADIVTQCLEAHISRVSFPSIVFLLAVYVVVTQDCCVMRMCPHRQGACTLPVNTNVPKVDIVLALERMCT